MWRKELRSVIVSRKRKMAAETLLTGQATMGSTVKSAFL